MPEQIKKKIKVEMALNPPEKNKEPEKRELPEGKLFTWNFPLSQRSVRAKNLQEAKEKIKTKK